MSNRSVTKLCCVVLFAEEATNVVMLRVDLDHDI